MLLALGIVMLIFPIEGIDNQIASSNNAKIGLDQGILSDKVLEVNAKISLKKKKTSKKSKYKKTVKKVKAAYKYRVKIRYKYKGKWRTKWVYRYYTPAKQVAAASNVGAYNVVVTSQYVYATGRHTCAISYDYNYHTRVFQNYNPATGHWGVLKFEQGSGSNNPEGMWVATDTDMDFCLIHGKSHDNRNVFLIPYNGIINGINVVNGYFTDPVVTPVINNTNTTDNANITTTDNTNVTTETNTTTSTNSTTEQV